MRKVAAAGLPRSAATAIAGRRAMATVQQAPGGFADAMDVVSHNRKALDAVRVSESAWASKAMPNLTARARKLGFSQLDLQDCLDAIRGAPVIVNFGPQHAEVLSATGHYLNMFEVSKGWERRFGVENKFFQYSAQTPVAARPRYGSLNAMGSSRGAWQYGDAMLVLRDHVRQSVTLTPCDSFEASTSSLGLLCGPLAQVLDGLDDNKLHSVLLAASGQCNHRLVEAHESYIEAQIHQRIDLRRDVAHVLMPRQAAVDADLSEYAKLNTLPWRWSGVVEALYIGDGKALAAFERKGWNVAAWSRGTHGHGFVFCPESASPETFTYKFVEVEAQQRAALLDSVGKSGAQIVGYEGRKTDTFLVKKSVSDQAARHYVELEAATLPEGVQALNARRVRVSAASNLAAGKGVRLIGERIEGPVAQRVVLVGNNAKLEAATAFAEKRGDVAAVVPHVTGYDIVVDSRL